MKRILYFTAGEQATSYELEEIATLNALAEKPYEVRVLNALQSPNYGASPIAGDFLAGTIPAAYKDEWEDPIYPVFDITTPPAPPTLPATQAIVSDGQVLGADDGGTVTLTIEDGVITSVVYAAGV